MPFVSKQQQKWAHTQNGQRALGGKDENAADFQTFAIVDGRLVTGQNPASSGLTAKLVLEALSTR